MTRLAELHKRLAQVRRRRRFTRLETAYSALAVAVLWVLGGLFLLDWLVVHVVLGSTTTPLQRLLLLVVGIAVVVWAFRRFTLPWLGKRETELDIALLVEREEHIDSDLVAAVQFETPEAPQWGSVQLEQAVIEQVAVKGGQINVMRGVPREELSRRSKLLLLTVLVWAAAVPFLYRHLNVFFNRLLLGAMHYPTRTVIESIAVSGREVDPIHPDRTPVVLRYGEPVRFEVRCSGELPDQGKATLASLRSSLRTALALEPVEDEPETFAGELPRLVEGVRYQVFLGDAWTDPARLDVGHLPNIELELQVDPPSYAKPDPSAGPVTMPQGLRQISVIEGSRVYVNVRSDKPLEEAVLTVAEKPVSLRRVEAAETGAADQSAETWVLDDPESPLAAVTEAIRYSLQVTDTDALQLEEPIEGSIRILADSAPRVAAAIVTKYVLPTAKPTVYLQAIDDYGLGRIAFERRVIHPDGQTGESESDVYRLPAGKVPEKNIEMAYPFVLTPLGLKKGDRLEVTVRAVDFRGDRPGRSADAEPLIFEVTDEAGILEHLTEADRQSVRQLKTMIQRQLGIGESP